MDGPTAIPASLVAYEDPIALNSTEESKKDAKPTGIPKSAANAQTEEILNSILPPRQWNTETGAEWMQYVCKVPATRLDVIGVQEQMDSRLEERQARATGICPVREDLYEQGFDELIRQITLNQPERGLLMLRMRDEAKMTIDAYKTLYDSSITFGVRKQVQAEHGVSEMEDSIKSLESECKALNSDVLELRNKVEVIEKRETEVRSLMEKKRKEEIDFLKYQGQNLDQFLKSISGGS